MTGEVFYRKIPVVVEAHRFVGSSTSRADIQRWIAGGEPPSEGRVHTRDIVRFFIETLEGTMEVSPGDYVIKGVAGEFYPCKPDIFALTYESVG